MKLLNKYSHYVHPHHTLSPFLKGGLRGIIDREVSRMNRLKSPLIFTLILPLFFSCATPKKDITTLPSFKLAESFLDNGFVVRAKPWSGVGDISRRVRR